MEAEDSQEPLIDFGYFSGRKSSKRFLEKRFRKAKNGSATDDRFFLKRHDKIFGLINRFFAPISSLKRGELAHHDIQNMGFCITKVVADN